MSKWRKELPKAWFGWNPGETEGYLRRLVALQDREAEEQEAAIRRERRLNQELRLKLELLGGLEPEPAPADNDRYTAMFIERLDRSVDAVRLQGDKELASIERMIKEKQDEHARQLAEMDEQFAEYEETLERLLQEAAGWMNKLKANVPGEAADDLAQKIRSELQKPVKAEELEEEFSPLSEAQPSESGNQQAEQKIGQAVHESVRSAKVIQFRLKSILASVEAAASLNQAQAPQVTADGTMVAEPQVNQIAQTASLAATPVSPPQMTLTPRRIVMPKPRTESKPSAFWGDLDPYLEQEEIYEQQVQPQFFAQAAEPAEPFQPWSGGSPVAAAAEGAPREIKAVPVKPPAAEEAPLAREGELESPALAQDIRFVQQRYIVGKIAGESLHDEAGKLIVAKGETITFEIVQKAEKAGKMPDLIVHMVIPGFGADV